MACLHCVAKDLYSILGFGYDNTNLRITERLIDSINDSPFMVIVISGGEPLIHDLESSLIEFLVGLKNKGIIIDTNGTLFPSDNLATYLRVNKAMLRVSWDSPNPNIECYLRKYQRNMFSSPGEYMARKEKVIRSLVSAGYPVAIQTVLYKRNSSDPNLLNRFPLKLKELGVHSWFLQRFIPSFKKREDSRYVFSVSDYEIVSSHIQKVAKKYDINCHIKNDKRHNSVFLLVQKGELYTQSDKTPGKKIYLGNLSDINHYFEFVSSSDHTARYLTQDPHYLSE